MFDFRKLDFTDMPQMFIWHNTDFVKRWFRFREYLTIEELTKDYEAKITGKRPDKTYIIVCDGIDIGYIQTYLICEYPKYNEHIQTDNHSSSIDLFIGHKDYIHKGYGVIIVNEFLQNHVFNNPQVDKCIIAPEPDNISAIKMYEKVGFKWYKNIRFDNGDEQYLMILTKKDFNYLFH